MTKTSSQKYDLIYVNWDIAFIKSLETADVLVKISNAKNRQTNKSNN